mmetsp:Transcript_97887/g.218436  ORF Transcript_97887/g.218436 Transcript_97887/m.218436 type:complete len:523 (-) Transcript_97887:110-1678(-)
MSQYFRKFVKRDPPPAALIRFRCAKLHRTTTIGCDNSSSEYNTIYDVLKSRGWKDTDADTDWHIFWTDKDWIHQTYDKIHLDPHQHVNHFLNHYELTRKDLLVKNMKRMRRACEKEGNLDEAQKYNVCPMTFVVPMEYNMFVEEFKKHPGSTWIMKPVGRSQGAGIFLVQKLAQLQQWRPPTTWNNGRSYGRDSKDPDDEEDAGREGPELYVVQRYVDSPLLIGGKKFDIRLYVIVTSFQPLTIYMHRGGFCRFSMSRYSMDKSAMTNLGQHLTNVAVQKHSGKAAYRRTGAKWDVNRLKMYLMSTVGIKVVNRLFTDIEAIVIHSLLSVHKVMINDKHCFELYGFDILIDTDYKPWLLEVNASPSLTANTVSDYDMKFGMLDDVLTVLDLEKYLSGNELQIGGFDLLYKDGLRYSPPQGSEFSSFLGCANNRLAQLERLAKERAWVLGCEARSSNSVVGPSGGSGVSPAPSTTASAPPRPAASPPPEDQPRDRASGESSVGRPPRFTRPYPPGAASGGGQK